MRVVKLCHGSITATCDVKKMPLANSKKNSHGGITITSEELPLPDFRRLCHCRVTITHGMDGWLIVSFLDAFL
jgi:hypothetical protein